jgi:hypothetical protein
MDRASDRVGGAGGRSLGWRPRVRASCLSRTATGTLCSDTLAARVPPQSAVSPLVAVAKQPATRANIAESPTSIHHDCTLDGPR